MYLLPDSGIDFINISPPRTLIIINNRAVITLHRNYIVSIFHESGHIDKPFLYYFAAVFFKNFVVRIRIVPFRTRLSLQIRLQGIPERAESFQQNGISCGFPERWRRSAIDISMMINNWWNEERVSSDKGYFCALG